MLLSIFPIGELAARLMGYKGAQRVSFSIESNPTSCLIGDSVLGFKLNPGSYTIRINKGLEYHANHTDEGFRTVNNSSDQKIDIGFFGCSFTYGMGVDDSLTFPYLIQQSNRNLSVANYSVPGYGTIQSLLQLQALEKQSRIPDTVFICFSKLHFDRNCLSPTYRKDLKLGYAEADKQTESTMHQAAFPFYHEGKLRREKWTALYTNWPLREYSALVNYLNCLGDKKVNSSIDSFGETLSIFKAVKEICDQSGSRLYTLLLDDDSLVDTLEKELNRMGIQTLRAHWSMKNSEETNDPYDDHMNALAHKRIARLIESNFLQ